jgi:hypothetical protein
MKENGKTISNTALEKKSGPTTVNMKVITLRARNMVKVFISGKMAQSITVTGLRTELKDMESISGKMAVCILENGKIITCTAKEFTLGLMEDDMKANMKWIRNMDSEYINGLTVVFTKVIGSMENNMEPANTYYKTG